MAHLDHPRAWTAHIDGASRGNPGPAACAVILEASDGSRVASLARRLGRTTNNFAEYQALLTALEYGLARGQRNLRVESDSELLVRQILGEYKVRSEALRPLYERAKSLMRKYDGFSIVHVGREQNREADHLANQALDGAGDIEIDHTCGARPEGAMQRKGIE